MCPRCLRDVHVSLQRASLPVRERVFPDKLAMLPDMFDFEKRLHGDVFVLERRELCGPTPRDVAGTHQERGFAGVEKDAFLQGPTLAKTTQLRTTSRRSSKSRIRGLARDNVSKT